MTSLEPIRAGLRSAASEWRAFGHRRFRTYQGIGTSAAFASALAGDGLTTPLLLALGAHPAVATVIGVLPFTFSAAQLLVPGLLRRADGNLRLVTTSILAVGETRGYWLALITFLDWARVVPSPVAIVLIGVVMSIGGASTTIGGTNLLAWYGAIMPDAERRFVAPRVMGITLGLGALMLVPVALLVQAGLHVIGIRVYAIVFALAGTAGLVELVMVRRLPRPGRVRVAERGTTARQSPQVLRFIRVVAIAQFGAGFGPYLSIYAISVLGLPPGFAIFLSAVGSAASLVGSTIVGSLLARGSASRTLRVSFLLRGGSMFIGLLALPANPLSWLVLCVVSAMASAGFAAGTLGANERLLRLTSGFDVIGAQGRFVAESATGQTLGQLSNAGLLAILPLGYPVFAILFAVSGITRMITAIRIEVSEAWSTSTMAFRIDDLQGGGPKAE
ncbi:MAG TPA: hypothetical protein VF802_04650 [Candidatus Limnocylindrales bacterium]